MMDFSPDSLTLIEISMALEEHFDVSIPDESWERIKTVGELFEFLAELLEQAKRG
jgi:acyl carrier protein